jgi:tetratricopeptide (TPR) repeat protein
VGPFATLLSAGVLNARDKVLVADFENRSSDSTLGQSVTEALRIDLARSAIVRLVETADVAAALRRMQRDGAEPLIGAVAREVAEREGAKAVVSGEIAPLGGGFVLSARVVAPSDGRTLLAERETATDAAGLIGAVDQLSRKIREGLGESLKSIRGGEPLETVTTGSLEALRAYTQAERAANRGETDQAVKLLEQALQRDSTFAMAWRKLGVMLSNSQQSPARTLDAVTRAYQLRDRLPERERLLAIAFYHFTATADLDSEIAAYEQVLDQWPDDITALNNLAIGYNATQRPVDAERVARRGLAQSAEVGVLWFNLVNALALQGRLDAADSARQEMLRVAPEVRNRFNIGFRIAAAKEDFPTAIAWADSAEQSGQLTLRLLAYQVRAALFSMTGRIGAAKSQLESAMRLARAEARPEQYLTFAITRLELDVWQGRPAVALRGLDSILSRQPLDSLEPADRPYLLLARLAVRAGDLERAERFYQTWERETPAAVREGHFEKPGTMGMMAAARNRPALAIELFRKARKVEACEVCWLGEIGDAFTELGQSDSTLAAYRELATSPELGVVPRATTSTPGLRRLAELYEANGDTTKSIEYYQKFIERWRRADADLQPRVTRAKQRLAELVGEPKS